MKLALLGDVHGNAGALAAVLAGARAREVEMLLVTGDLVGYYYEPAKVVDMLAEWPIVAVRGNHEDYLAEAAANPEAQTAYRAKYGSGLDAAHATLAARQIAWLNALPRTASLCFDGVSILLCHGAPRDTDEYIYPSADATVIDSLAAFGHDIVVMGHTHWRQVWRGAGVLAVNPGSVGQPRDRKPGAAWALLDTKTRRIDLFTESYDIAEVVAQAAQRDPGLPYLQQVLLRT